MKISVVIPNWNGEEQLKKNLPKVIEACKGRISEIVISDDASTDKSVELIKKDFPEIKLVESQHKKNLGFSSNVNLGFSGVQGDLVILLNNDAYPEKGFLDAALPHFDNPKVFSVGLSTGGSWNYAGFENGFIRHHMQVIDKTDFSKSHQSLWASGGSAIFQKCIWDELNGLDTLFDPFYEEDFDLGYRATKRGYINIWEPKSKVFHYLEKGVIESSFSKSKINHVAERNNLILTWKNLTSKKLLSQHQSALIKRLFLHPKYWQIFISATSKYPEIMKKRKIEKSQAKLTDEEIFSLFTNNQI
jgi:GT2 family glycosyltransferase